MSDTVPLSENSWSPPLQGGESVYPYNNVQKSRSGHLHEIDDTLGAERIHRQHKSGSSETFVADGSRVLNILGDDWIAVVRDSHLFIGGNAKITIMGDCETVIEGNYNLHVKKDLILEVDGKIKTKVNSGGISADIVGDLGHNVSGNHISVVHGGTERKSLGGENVTIGKDLKTNISGNSQTVTNGDTVNISKGKSILTAGSTMSIGANSGIDIGSGTSITVNAPSHMNLEAGDLNVTDNVNVEKDVSVSQNVSVDGQTDVKGTITSETDVLGQTISLVSHLHIETGSVTLPPTP